MRPVEISQLLLERFLPGAGGVFATGVAFAGCRTSDWTRRACDEVVLLEHVVVGTTASRPVSWAAPGACLR
jgi:hypothetical protein